MMRRDVLLIVISCFVACAFIGTVNGQTDFYNDAVITEKEHYDWIRVFDTSIIDNYGFIDHCQMYDTGILNLGWGSIGRVLECFNYSTVNVHGFVFHNLSFSEVWLHDFSTFNIHDDGAAITLIFGQDSSTINVYGGDAYFPYITNNATLNVHGGDLQPFPFIIEPPVATATINIYGWDFIYEPQAYWMDEVQLWQSRLTGVGVYGAIDIYGLADPAIYDNVNLIVIPEPYTLSLLALGGLALMKKRWE